MEYFALAHRDLLQFKENGGLYNWTSKQHFLVGILHTSFSQKDSCLKGSESKVCLLRKALYGWTQGALITWNETMDAFNIRSQGLPRSRSCWFQSLPVNWIKFNRDAHPVRRLTVEHKSLVEGVKELIWLRTLIYIERHQPQSTSLYCDNISTIKLAKNPRHTRENQTHWSGPLPFCN